MTKEPLCTMTEECDVEVSRSKYDRHSFAVKVKGLSSGTTNIHSSEDMLNNLIALREAGYKVPQPIIRKIANEIVNDTFNYGDRL